ncbi:DedA family protein [Nocardia sp. CA-119907]|uniref:DedA family protein n=1 Tax=Nocardia sp. CA-119907 TaxID=3239973 RepID=UPI003D960DB5
MTGFLDSVHGPVLYAVVALTIAVLFVFPVGALLPGEPFLIAVGVLASEGELSLPLALAVVLAAVIVTPLLAFRTGDRIYSRIRRRPADSRMRKFIKQSEDVLDKRGEIMAAVVCWVPPLRGTVPMLMGAARYSFPRFLAFSALGTTVWAVLFVTGGYLAAPLFSRLAVCVGIVGILAAVIPAIAERIKHVRRRRAAAASHRIGIDLIDGRN